MSYQQNVEASHRTTYADNIQMVRQEVFSKLRNAVTIVSGLTGDAHNVRDLLEESEYNEAEDRSMRNPENHDQLDPVWLTRPKVIDWGRTIFKEDKFDMAMDPTSNFNRNGVRAVEKGVFDRFLGVVKNDTGFEIGGGGILGKRISGKDHSVQNGLPAGQYVPTAGNGLTLEKLNEAREMLELNDFGLDEDMSDMLFCMISPKQKSDLLKIAIQAQESVNAFQMRQIEMGQPTSLFGATWIFTNRLPVDANGDRICPMWTKDNVVGAFWQDIQGDMWNRSDAKNRPYVYIDAYPTGTRLEDKGVVAIPCVES